MASDSLPTPPPSITPTPAATASGSQAADAPSAPAAGVPVPPAAATGTQAAPPTQAEMLESLLQQIVTSNSPAALAGTLRNVVGTPEAREEVLAGTTSTGADPLEALDVVQHSIGALFILYVCPFNCSPFLLRARAWIFERRLLKRNERVAGLHVLRPRQAPRPQYRSRISNTFAGNLIQNMRALRLSVVRFANILATVSSRSDAPLLSLPSVPTS